MTTGRELDHCRDQDYLFQTAAGRLMISEAALLKARNEESPNQDKITGLERAVEEASKLREDALKVLNDCRKAHGYSEL